MFNTPEYIQNTLSIFFQRKPDIRRRANELEDILQELYTPPHVFSVVDDANPEEPRILFSSKNGYSQIIISQISMALVVRYSPEFQVDIARGRNYLANRVSVLFDLLSQLEIQPYFCGFSTLAQLRSNQDDRAIVEHVANRFLKDPKDVPNYDIEIKFTNLVSNQFFSNIAIASYRQWEVSELPQRSTRLPLDDVSERGLQITGDFNDRYAFNEQQDYQSTRENAQAIIDGGLAAVAQTIENLRGVPA